MRVYSIRRIAPLIAFALLLAPLVAAPAFAEPIPRILVVGDSWSFFLYNNRSLQRALQEAGLGEFEEVGLYTSVPGSTVEQWIQPRWLGQIEKELDRHPTVDIVHLMIGGNDFLRRWDRDMDEEAEEALFDEMAENIETVIDYCLAQRDGLRVAMAGYDYVNRGEGGMSAEEINVVGHALSKRLVKLAERKDRVAFINSFGLMHHHFGVPGKLEPGEPPAPGNAPDYEPLLGGVPGEPNVPESMSDDIHLSGLGYDKLAEHCIDVLYRAWLTEGVEEHAKVAASEAESRQ